MRVGAAIAVLSLLASACGGDDASSDGGGDSLVVANPAEVGVLDPHNPGGEQVGSASRAVTNGNVFETLVRRLSDGSLSPQLATDLPELQDDGAWRFTLREGVEFSNGETFDADTVVFNVERVLDPDYNAGIIDFFAGVTGAEKVDDLTVEITTEGIDSALPSRMTLLYMVPIEGSQADDFETDPIGTGPYLYTGRVENGVTLEANADYWGDQPSITDVEIRAIEDTSTRIAALQAGEVDLIYNLPPDLTDGIPKVASVPGPENPIVVLNSHTGITQDPRVRQALNLAVDREALAEDLFSGYAAPSQCQMSPPSASGFADAMEPYPYDPDRARELIDEAGVEGETVTFYTSPYFVNGREIAEVVAASWADIGITADLKVVELQTYIDEATLPGDEGPEAVYVSTSDELFDASRAWASYLATDSQRGRYSNPEADALVQQAINLPDGDERNGLFAEAAQLACDDAAVVFLLTTEDVWGVAEDVDFEPRPDGELHIADISRS